MSSNKKTSKPLRPGIIWPKTKKGDRSSTETLKKIWSASFAAMGEDKTAKAVLDESKWRFKYNDYVKKHVAASLSTPDAALKAAKAGLQEARDLFEFLDQDGNTTSFADAVKNSSGSFETGFVKGSKPKGTPELEVPYKGKTLRGKEIEEQLKKWRDYGTIEPSAADGIAAVARNKQWADLSDMYFVMLGAGSAMGPYPLLLALGANVIAVDLNRKPIWDRLLRIARDSPGNLYFPLAKSQASLNTDDDLAANAGCDLLADAPRVAKWLTQVLPDKALTVGSYVYLDGEAHVRLVLACDAITSEMIQKRKAPVSLAFLCTPTDCHVIPAAAWAAARAQQNAVCGARVVKALVAPFSSKALASNVAPPVSSEDGETFTYVDGIVVEQGPNYATAKRMQHWRAILARDAGCIVSSNIAPSTSTVSVTSNRLFAWAYNGVTFFKPMEIFAPETSHAVMTALLINDLRDKKSVANPNTKLRNPLELFASGGFHGGVWRTAYTFGSVGTVSVLIHFVKVGAPYVIALLLLLFVYKF
eukprot:CAMPEP_0168590366 /NCGR_PEP_ID=MMETSP0420-20121227/6530_1 /TAXON_ID=498008 /ORGANISM="Pessonella sp." /LENGTH=530 /DNA_ID=CAMNT_0008626021 /DNA_START=34 /DNA_END=1623 /DNA_ORIENTATION=+